jgi:hypothetical protein
MEIVINKIDAAVYGRNFLEIQNFSYDLNFSEFEQEYVEKFKPYYVAVKIPVENLEEIHFLERLGFCFIEIQIRETLKLKRPFTSNAFSPYKIEIVTSKSDLNAILDIASNTFRHDRFTMDPMIPDGFSGMRYRLLVRRSFDQENEFVYKFFNGETGEILGFKTHKIISDDEALMFLGGIVEKYKRSPLPAINGYLELNELYEKGIRKVTTHISGSNYGVLNLEVKEFGYKVARVFTVLRKIYK